MSIREEVKEKLASAFDPNNAAEYMKEASLSEVIKDLDRTIEKNTIMATASMRAGEVVTKKVKEDLAKLEQDVQRCFNSIIGNIDKLKDVL